MDKIKRSKKRFRRRRKLDESKEIKPKGRVSKLSILYDWRKKKSKCKCGYISFKKKLIG